MNRNPHVFRELMVDLKKKYDILNMNVYIVICPAVLILNY